MKGIIFTELSRMVEENFGMALWNEALDTVNPESQGIYVATSTYNDEELSSLVAYISKRCEIPTKDLLYKFGTYLFPIFAKKYAVFIQPNMNFKDFLKSIDNIIHVEVTKLNPNASLPKIDYDESDANHLTLFYSSPRKLCHLAVGLIHGASIYFKEEIAIDHDQCMHDGFPHCQLNIQFPQE